MKNIIYLQLIITSHVPSNNPHKAAIEQYATKSFGTATHWRIHINSVPCKTSVIVKILLRPTNFATALANAAAIVFANPKQIMT